MSRSSKNSKIIFKLPNNFDSIHGCITSDLDMQDYKVDKLGNKWNYVDVKIRNSILIWLMIVVVTEISRQNLVYVLNSQTSFFFCSFCTTCFWGYVSSQWLQNLSVDRAKQSLDDTSNFVWSHWTI